MPEKIKPGQARAQAAHQELANLRSKYQAKYFEAVQNEKFGAFDDVEPEAGSLTYEQYLAQRPAAPESGVTRANDGSYRDSATGRFVSQATYLDSQVSSADHYREFIENDDPETELKLASLASKYAQARLVNDKTSSLVALDLIDQKLADHASHNSISEHQVATIKDRVMQMAQTMFEGSSSWQDHALLDAQELISKYVQAESSNDQSTASQALGDIDALVADYTSKYNLQSHQVAELYDSIMDRAQAAADDGKADELTDIKVDTSSSKIDDLADIKTDESRNQIDDLSDIVQPRGRIDDLTDLAVAAPIDDLADIQVPEHDQVDDLSDIVQPRDQVDGLADLAVVAPIDDLADIQASERGQVDDLSDTVLTPAERQAKAFDSFKQRVGRAGNFIKDNRYKAAAVLSVAMFRAGHWLGKQHIKPNESISDFERRRNNNTGQKVAVGAVAVGAALATWILFDKHGDNHSSGIFDWINNWRDGDSSHEAPTVTESPVDAGNGGAETPTVGEVDPGETEPIKLPESDSAGAESQADSMPGIAVTETVAMPELDSGNYVYPWDWAGDKFGSQNSRKVLNTLVSQTDGAVWHRLGDGVDTNDWISINGRSDTKYVIEQLSQTANANPELVESMYRG